MLKSFKIENTFLIEKEDIEFISQMKQSAIIQNDLNIQSFFINEDWKRKDGNIIFESLFE